MGRGIIRLDTRLILELLKLPEKYKAVSTWCNDRGDIINIIVDSTDIPEVEEAEPFPTIEPVYEVTYIQVDKLKVVEVQRHIQTNETTEETIARLGIRKRGD